MKPTGLPSFRLHELPPRLAEPTDTEVGSGRPRFERPGETYDTPRDMPLVRYTVSPG